MAEEGFPKDGSFPKEKSYPRRVEARLNPQEEVPEEKKKFFDIHLRFSLQAYSDLVYLTITFDDYEAQRDFYKDYEDKRVVFVCSIKGMEVRINEKQYPGDFGVGVGHVSEFAKLTQMHAKYCYNEKEKYKPL